MRRTARDGMNKIRPPRSRFGLVLTSKANRPLTYSKAIAHTLTRSVSEAQAGLNPPSNLTELGDSFKGFSAGQLSALPMPRTNSTFCMAYREGEAPAKPGFLPVLWSACGRFHGSAGASPSRHLSTWDSLSSDTFTGFWGFSLFEHRSRGFSRSV